MGFSRSVRIITLLVIDSLFFLLEIIVGYSVHSLALVADSFHMVGLIHGLLLS
jgi:zinc transporter 1